MRWYRAGSGGVWVGVRWHGCRCRGDLSGDTRFAQGPISPRPAHSPTEKPRRLGVAASTTPPPPCTPSQPHARALLDMEVRAHGRTGARAQGREVTRWLSNNKKTRTDHKPQRQAPSPVAPSASCHLTPTHTRIHTHTHTVGKAKVSVLAEVGWANHWELPYLPPRVEGRGGGLELWL
jgi:hypothetical protein